MEIEENIEFIKDIAQDEEKTKIFLNLLGTFILMNEEIEEYEIDFKGNIPNKNVLTKGKFKFEIKNG